MNLKIRFLAALHNTLSDEEVNECGEALYNSLLSYLMGTVRGRLAQVYSGFEFHKDENNRLVATRKFDLDAGVLVQAMKLTSPEIKERPLDVVLKDRQVQDVTLAMLVKIIDVLNRSDMFCEMYAAPYVGDFQYVDTKLQAVSPLSFSISFYIKRKVNDLLDQNVPAGLLSLRKRVIRLAHTRNDLRASLLPLLLR